MTNQTKTFLQTKLPVILAILLLIPIYTLPIWWVSLTAPNYPPESFPDGVKIHFHAHGVFNGCEAIEKEEIQDLTLDCVHEMDTINHYVGMYPIAAGGPIEILISIFLLSLLGVMLLGYLVNDSKKRTITLATGFTLIAIWFSVVLYAPNGLKYHHKNFIAGRVVALGEGSDSFDEEMSAAEALIASMKASLAESGVEIEGKNDEPKTQKEKDIAFLKDAFESNQRSLGIQEEWNGSGIQLLGWHYRTSLARWFNDPGKNNPMVNNMVLATNILFWIIILMMAGFLYGARKTNSLVHKLLVLIPIALPILFVIIYAAWLSWYGHNMNSMGAFTLKPFMPTVFGQGKVAQFTTNSYPHIGFFLMLTSSALLLFAFLSKLNQGEKK